MHLAVLITVFLGLANSQPVSENINNSQEHQKFFLYTDENVNIQVEHLVDVPVDLNATAADVAYYYFSQSNPENGVEIHSNNIDAIKNSAYSSLKDTIFIIHGWKNSMESDVNSHIREYILRDHDINVFVVDWSPIAEKNYVSAKNSVKKVGEYVADFARGLSNSFGLQLNKLKFVGHSLGAHVSGCAGAALSGEVDRIVGLDPAGPLFSDSDISNRIDPTDANFVQIIHTNDGMLGYSGILGHADYYPNGGQKQGGCGVDLTGSCSHSRVYELYAESLQTNQFIAQNCASYDDYTKKTCYGGFSSMGMFNVDTNTLRWGPYSLRIWFQCGNVTLLFMVPIWVFYLVPTWLPNQVPIWFDNQVPILFSNQISI